EREISSSTWIKNNIRFTANGFVSEQDFSEKYTDTNPFCDSFAVLKKITGRYCTMRKECSVFGTEIRKSAERFFSFAKSHKGVISILALWLLFLYGVRIFYYDISIDSEAALSSQQELLDSWLTIDRFGLVF